MEYHRVGMAYKVATGVVGDTTFNFTSSQAINSKWVGVAVFRQTGVTDWALDASSFAGSNTTNVSSIALGSTGTLSSATGVAVVAGTSRTGSEGLTTSVGTSLSGTDADFEVDAGSANFIAAWADLSATTALDATISESNGSSRMGAGIAVFVEAGGGSPSTGTGTGTISVAGPATGTVKNLGTATGTISAAGVATGTVKNLGTATGTVSVAGPATGTVTGALCRRQSRSRIQTVC